jgi:hypothetical protein
MKLADRVIETHSAGVRSESGFTIAQTSKMFKILSDSLYSDKVMAVIRELSTNAYDAHIAAKNPNPFRVTLPTQTNPSFTVRDFGTGLSQSDMEELYTTYGASNKNDSNDFVGCLGLGSKSPFAYTKSFSTISYYNGKKLSYIAAMDEAGVPSLNLVSVSDTKESNGLEISFAVKQFDFHEFTTKAKRIFHYFKLKPIISGGICSSVNDNSYSHHNIVIEGTGWKIGRVSNDHSKYPSSHNSPGSGVVAIMGNIAYPVDSSKIIGEDRPDQPDHIQKWNRAFGKADVDNWKSLVREILNAGLYLEVQFGIGELEMDVSREGLQYTKNVIKTLRDRTQEIYLELKKDMSDKLSTAKNLVEAYQTYYNLSDLAGGWTAGASWTDSNGKVHELQSGKDLEYTLKKNKQLYVFNYRTAGYRSRRMVYLTDRIHAETLNGKGQYYWQNNRKGNPIVFFVCDVKGEESAKKIVTKYCNQNDCYAYLLIDSDHPEDSSEGFDKIITDIGGESSLLNISDYRSLLASGGTRKSRGSTGTISKDEIFAITDLGSDKDCKILGGNLLNDSHLLKELSESLVDYIEDEDNEIVYVPIVRYSSVEGYPELNKIVALSRDENIVIGKKLFDSQKIFAIKQSSVDKLKKSGINLVSFNEWFKKYVQKIETKLSESVSVYADIIEYCQKEFESNDPTYNGGYYYNCRHSDRQIVYHIFNIFGLDYAKHIQNQDMIDLIDQWLLIEFFTDTINRDQFDIRRFDRTEYFTLMTKILAKYELNGLDPAKIRTNHISLKVLHGKLNDMYGAENNPITKSLSRKSNSSIVSKLPKMVELRKNLKDQVDKVPMLKYIVGVSETNGNIRGITTNNPIRTFDNGYRGKPEWTNKIDADALRVSLGSLI